MATYKAPNDGKNSLQSISNIQVDPTMILNFEYNQHLWQKIQIKILFVNYFGVIGKYLPCS